MVRRSFTILELIVSVTVLGIVVMSIPNVLMVSSKANMTTGFVQEDVYKAYSYLNQITGTAWDETVIDVFDSTGTIASTIVDVSGGSGHSVNGDRQDTSAPTISLLRRGVVPYLGNDQYSPSMFRRAFSSDINFSTAVASLGMDTDDAGVPDDIDDFNGITKSVIKEIGYGYTHDTQISCNAFYVDDTGFTPLSSTVTTTLSLTALANSSGVKLIECTAQPSDTSLDAELRANQVVLRFFKANIGLKPVPKFKQI